MSWFRSQLTLGAAVLLALTACDKGTDLGVDLPTATPVSADYLDIPLRTSVVQYDSLETLKSDHFMAGQLRDNLAGTSTAISVMNLQASTLTDSLPSKFPGAVLDSVVFTQGFDVVYGSSSALARFDLIRLSAPLSETARYTSSTVPTPFLGQAAAQNMPTRLDRQQAVVDTACKCTTYVADPTVRLVLYKPARGIYDVANYSTRLFSRMASSAPVFTQTQLNLAESGLAIAPSTGYDQAIVSFGRNASSRLAFYFHSSDIPAKWHSYALYVGPSPTGSGAALARDPRYYTYLKSDVSGTPLAPLADARQSVPTAALDNLAYVQDGVGLGTKIEFDAGLAPLRDEKGVPLKGLAINRAELYVPVKPYSTALFPNASGLFALEVNAQNRVLQRTSSLTLTDRIVQRDGAVQTGVNNEALATLVDAKTTAPYYLMPVTSYLQAYLNNSLDGARPAALVLLPTIRRSQNLTLNRSVLDANGARLRVYYSKLR